MKWIRYKISTLSLRWRLILSAVLCLILPVIITVAASNYVTKDVIKEQTTNDTISKLEMANLYISSLINRMIYTANFIHFDSEINILLKKQRNQMMTDPQGELKLDILDYQTITEKLKSASVSENEIYVSVIITEKLYYTNYSYSDYRPSDFYSEEWFQHIGQLPEDKTNWLGIHENYMSLASNRENPYMVSFVRLIKGASSQPIGYIIVSMNEKLLSDSFSKNGSNTMLMIVDSQGFILSHQDKDMIGQRFPYDDFIAEENRATIVKLDNKEYMLVKHSLFDWYLISLTPYNEATSRISEVHNVNMFVQIVFFSLFLLVLVYLIRQFTKPIVKLGNIASKVEDGNLGIRSKIRGNHEIGKLGYSFDKMLDRLQEMIETVKLEQTRKREAELKMLQAQINPHFLFNILNSIRLKIKLKNDHENADLIHSLSALLRMTITRNNEFIPLSEEFDIVAQYVKLMNVRRKEGIDIIVNLPVDCGFELVPRFIIQPLVENVFNHAIRLGGGVIILSASRNKSELVISVEDSGVGMTEEELDMLLQKLDQVKSNNGVMAEIQSNNANLSGIGIQNVYERLYLIHGELFRIEIESQKGKGSIFRLYLPVKAHSPK